MSAFAFLHRSGSLISDDNLILQNGVDLVSHRAFQEVVLKMAVSLHMAETG